MLSLFFFVALWRPVIFILFQRSRQLRWCSEIEFRTNMKRRRRITVRWLMLSQWWWCCCWWRLSLAKFSLAQNNSIHCRLYVKAQKKEKSKIKNKHVITGLRSVWLRNGFQNWIKHIWQLKMRNFQKNIILAAATAVYRYNAKYWINMLSIIRKFHRMWHLEKRKKPFSFPSIEITSGNWTFQLVH